MQYLFGDPGFTPEAVDRWLIGRLKHTHKADSLGRHLKGNKGEEASVRRIGIRLVSRGTSVRFRFGSPFSSNIVVC